MEHTEVYFLYTSKTASDGYVWMRQALADIIKSCVGNLCLSLTYDEQITQIQRFFGLLQLTATNNFLYQALKTIQIAAVV